MARKTIAVVIATVFTLCTGDILYSAEKPQTSPAPAAQFQFSKDRELQQLKPKKAVRVKLHRNTKGEYSWDLTGESVDDVVKADKRIRKMLFPDEEPKGR